MSEPQVQATHYEVTLVPREQPNGRWYIVHVASIGRGRWTVYREHCEVGETKPVLLSLGPDGAWSETESVVWFAPDYELEEALELARAAAPHVVVAGRSAAEEAASAGPVRSGEEPTT